MPDSVGIDRRTGKILTDREHVKQSISVILRTPLRKITRDDFEVVASRRRQRRWFGSEVQELIDRPMTTTNIMRIKSAVYVGLELNEPRFKLTDCDVIELSETGQIIVAVAGRYIPKGHIGFDAVNDNIIQVNVPFGVAA